MSFKELELGRHYDSDSIDGLLDIYKAIIKECRTYDRFTGYFSSSIYGAVEFLLGESWRQPEKVLRMICSPELSARDVEAISAGYSLREASEDSILRCIDELWLETSDSNLGVRALASLIANGQLEIKIATPKSGQRLFHSKIGLFEDVDGNWLYFHGGANESYQGLALNWDTLDLKFSWGSDDDVNDIDHWKKRFEDAWGDKLTRFDVVPFPEVAKEKLSQYTKEEPSEVADELSRFFNRLKPKGQVEKRGLPKLFEYQSDVLKAWEDNSFRGIIDHVTGAGKTITALTAIRDHCAQGLPALVLVPRDGLQSQWISEIDQYMAGSVSVLAVGGSLGGGASNWSKDLPRFTSPDKALGGRVIVAVVRSASGQEFQRRIRTGGHLLVVADEVHNMGSPTARTIMTSLESTKKRLGLSATYKRSNDEVGTTAIEEFFGNVLQPPFGIRDAIREGRLVPYYYDFEVCNLNEDEIKKFKSLTQRIMGLSGKEDDSSKSSLTQLLSQRAKVIKSAGEKVEVARRVFERHYTDTDRWLVYCDDKNQLEAVFDTLSSAGYPCAKYYADMSGSKSETLDYLSIPGKVVISIKCLDEGINIPEVDKALILASSTNPREYIQRRGRVLRKSKNKTTATIIDVLVLDDNDSPVLRSEIDRMSSFIDDSVNDAPRLKLVKYMSGQLLQSYAEDFEELEEEE
jgi:superfamily II DNA or RNA helicase